MMTLVMSLPAGWVIITCPLVGSEAASPSVNWRDSSEERPNIAACFTTHTCMPCIHGQSPASYDIPQTNLAAAAVEWWLQIDSSSHNLAS